MLIDLVVYDGVDEMDVVGPEREQVAVVGTQRLSGIPRHVDHH